MNTLIVNLLRLIILWAAAIGYGLAFTYLFNEIGFYHISYYQGIFGFAAFGFVKLMWDFEKIL